MKQENRIIILTTHHLEEAEALADKICIMSQGKILALGNFKSFIPRDLRIHHVKVWSWLPPLFEPFERQRKR